MPMILELMNRTVLFTCTRGLKFALFSAVLLASAPVSYAGPIFVDTLDDDSKLTVVTGNFFAYADPAFNPDPIFGRNDGAGGGDFGGDTPGDRTTYNGFDGGFIEANGILFGSRNPAVIEWQGIDISGESNLFFSAAFASALQPDVGDSVLFEAIVDGGAATEIIRFISLASDSVFQTSDDALQLNDTAQLFERSILGTGSSLTLRATLSLSGTHITGDDIAFDTLTVFSKPTQDVPAPGTLGLIALGLAGLGWRRRKQA